MSLPQCYTDQSEGIRPHGEKLGARTVDAGATFRAWLLPCIGTVLAVAGLILLVAGWSMLALPELPDPETQPRAQREVSAPRADAGGNPRRLSFSARSRPEIRPSARRSAATPRSRPEETRSSRNPDALLLTDGHTPNLTGPQNLIPDFVVIEEERDARWNLMEMAGLLRGDWAQPCPCPVYAPDTKTGPR